MNARALVFRTAAAAYRPDADLSVSEWADTHRVLSSVESPEPGLWRTSRTEYLRAIMDELSVNSSTRRVVLMKAAQVAGTEAILNLIGYTIHKAPGPMLVVQPTVELGERFSRQRVSPLITNSEALRARVAPNRSRDGGNALGSKEWPGGILIITGANSAAALRSMPIRTLALDEVDAYPLSVDNEGDPVDLAIQRTVAFRRRKIFIGSTPTTKGMSRIEAAYEDSDQRRFYVPCGDCGEMQTLEWAACIWPEGHPADAAYVCRTCGCEWSDAARNAAVAKGEWRASKPFNGTAGFHLSALYSPWVKLGDLATDFVQCKAAPERLRVFVNTVLAETWSEQGQGVDSTGLLARREPYEASPVPDGVAVITAGVDVQDDRIELEIVGWGRGEENWSLDYVVLHGDPSAGLIWTDLEQLLSRTYAHPTGATLHVEAACIDSGGHHTQAVYSFAKLHFGRRWWAIKGIPGMGRPIIGKPSKNNKQRVRLFPVGVDVAKTRVYARLQVSEPGAGYCHFPTRYDADYFAQLTAEKCVTRYHKGFPRREWIKKSDQRNEALDCRVYAVAALENLPRTADNYADALLAAQAQAREPDRTAPLPASGYRGSSFVNSWR